MIAAVASDGDGAAKVRRVSSSLLAIGAAWAAGELLERWRGSPVVLWQSLVSGAFGRFY